jgi:FkbM family methyltransferase
VLLSGLCQGGKVFVDVGAHIGSVVDSVRRGNPTVKVIAFEAIPDKVAHIRRKFPDVEVYSCAVGEDTAETTFFVHAKRSGYSSLGRPSASARPDVTEIKVQLRRLDDLVTSREVDLVKIDVEGAELGVLRGADRLISENRPTVMFESGPVSDDGLGYSKEELFAWLHERDYTILVPNRVAHDDAGLNIEGFLEGHLYPRRTTNYFAVPRERRLEIRDRARGVLKILVQ